MTGKYDENNIFAKILRGDIPCNTVYEDDHVLAFHDISPQAPIHILVIPKGKYIDIADFGANANSQEIKAFWNAVYLIAAEQGINSKGFRVISNSGPNAGQEVPHFHAHILGGRTLGPMLSQDRAA